MPYAYQQVKEQIKFDYDNLSDDRFLKSLRYVKSSHNGRIFYEIRFPNSPIEYEDSLILSLKEGAMKIYSKHTHLDGLIKVEVSTIEDLVQSFPLMGSYDKFVASSFLSCAFQFD